MSQHLFPVTPVNLSLKSCNWRCNIPFMLSIGGRYFFPPLPDTLEIPWIFLFAILGPFSFFGQPCDYPIHLLSWVSGHSLNHQRTCCKNFAALYTRFFWLCDIIWIFSWFLKVGIKITLLHHWLNGPIPDELTRLYGGGGGTRVNTVNRLFPRMYLHYCTTFSDVL